MSSARQDWRTPKALFRAVSAIAGGFDVDLAADAESRLCDLYFGPDNIPSYQDALVIDWQRRYGLTKGWLNPPYGKALPLFAAKAVEQINRHSQLEVWMLVPARTDTRWWNLLMTRAVHVWFMAGRVKFERPDRAHNVAPFPTAVIQLRHDGGRPGVTWGWRP